MGSLKGQKIMSWWQFKPASKQVSGDFQKREASASVWWFPGKTGFITDIGHLRRQMLWLPMSPLSSFPSVYCWALTSYNMEHPFSSQSAVPAVLPSNLAHPQPAHWKGSMRKRVDPKVVQTVFSHSKNVGLLSALFWSQTQHPMSCYGTIISVLMNSWTIERFLLTWFSCNKFVN